MIDGHTLLTGMLGLRLTLWVGKAVAAPAPVFLTEALTEASVSLSDEGMDGFSLTFAAGRRSGVDLLDSLVAASPLLRPFNRIILQVWFGVFPEVLIDGLITNVQLQPSSQPGASRLTVIGEDIRVAMDMHETARVHPGQSPEIRVQVVLSSYMGYLGTPPVTFPATVPDVSLPTERIPAQAATDLQYINSEADRTGYVFFVEPQAPMVNLAYWGPSRAIPMPQGALSVNMGPHTNVERISFRNDARMPAMVLGAMQDRNTGLPLPVMSVPVPTRPPLTPMPSILAQQPDVRRVFPQGIGGHDLMRAMASAQAQSERTGEPVTAEGELDAARYGRLLRPRRIVGVRGAGVMNDGYYYVKRVSHHIRPGSYKQSFTLRRDGHGPLTPVVLS
jgi:hypothetical protein